ncbi:ABC transporter substrate-binding protein [Candidatus Stoquefichus massiliensis]|uniref:ABC transporter substrate-binding protein n=1 Tax=Candidatus Stoquefichus massiliensis TaxID=1470350 RepID=UPI0004BA4695|nr:sugar ABC transporter substrate-binding protein [Candidatus Stoquefichus massiliensis]
MNKKHLIILILVIGCVLTLVCWPQTIVLRIGIFAGSNWDVPSGDCYVIIDQSIERFEKEHPNVKVEYESGILKEDYSQWLSEQYLKGNEPDIFMILSEDFNTLSYLGALKNLNQFIQEDQSFDTQQYYKSALQAGKYQDKQYALPYESNPTLMFVNKTLLQKEGISMPKNHWTLDDFYKICQKVTKDSNHDGVIDQYGCYNFNWLDSLYSHGARLFNETGTECYVNQSSVKDSISFIQKLNELNQGHNITSHEFDQGQVAFSPMPFSQYRTYKPYPWRVKKYSNFEWDCVKMPSLSLTQNSTQVSSLLMGMSARSHHTQIAWEFLKMLSYDEQTQKQLFQYSQGISSLKSVTQSKEALLLLNDESLGDSQVDMSLLNEVMENTVNHSQFKKYESTLNLLNTSIQQIIQNDEEVDISLITLQKEINQYLKE